MIRGFKPSVKFGLVASSTDARAWRPAQLVDANDRNKRAALEWIGALQPNGATLAEKALDTAFSFEEADTIIFVTDGARTNGAGRPYDPTRWRDLLDQLKHLNKVRHVRIDVLTMAEGSTDFARNLARENGGQYATVP